MNIINLIKEEINNVTPKIGYHGSNALFDTFRTDLIGKNNDVNKNNKNNNDKYGFFFTNDKQEAIETANNIYKRKGGKPILYKTKLTINNPYTLKDFFYSLNNEKKAEEIYNNTMGSGWGIFDTNKDFIINDVKKLKKDGILFRNNQVEFIVVFNPNQIEILNQIELQNNENIVNEGLNDKHLYHGTSNGALRRIIKQGLIVNNNIPIFFSNNKEYSKSYAKRKDHTGGVILRVNMNDNFEIADNILASDNYIEYISDENISPEKIEIESSDGSWIPIKNIN